MLSLKLAQRAVREKATIDGLFTPTAFHAKGTSSPS